MMDGGDAKFSGVSKWRMAPSGGGGGLVGTGYYGPAVDGAYRQWGGEPVLSPKKGRAALRGDEVWVLNWVHNEATGAHELVVLDGESDTLAEVLRLAIDDRPVQAVCSIAQA